MMKKMFRRTPIKAFILLLTVAVLLLSGVQTTRAALTVQSNYYQAQANMKEIGIAIVENGRVVDDGRLLRSVPTPVGASVPDTDFHYGVRYQENLAVQNTGEIDQYVRVMVSRYWAELDKNGNVSRKLTNLDPTIIDINFLDNGWTVDPESVSGERIIVYYTANSGILPVGAISAPFADSFKVDGEIQYIVTKDVAKDGTVTYIYTYDGAAFVIEAEAQGVQTHNAEDAISSDWGCDAVAILKDVWNDGPIDVPVEPVSPTEDYITVTYKAGEGGYVGRTSETLAVSSGMAQGSTATANTGYHFMNWTDASGNVVSTAATFVPAKVNGMNTAATYTANFAKDGDITITYMAGEGGSVDKTSESLAPSIGSPQGSTAIAAEGYSFANWTDLSGNIVGTDETYIPAKVNGLNVAGTYTANFEEEFVIINYMAAGEGGSVSSSTQSVKAVTGTAHGATATANAGYSFVNWTDASGNVVSTDATFIPEKVNGLNVAGTYIANFEEEFVIINYIAAGEGGTVSSSTQSVKAVTGTARGATATANAGYRFVNWTDASGNVVSTDATFIPEKVNGVNVSTTYVANFTVSGQNTGVTPGVSG